MNRETSAETRECICIVYGWSRTVASNLLLRSVVIYRGGVKHSSEKT